MAGIVQVESVDEWGRLREKLDALEGIGTAAEAGRQESETALDDALREIAGRCQKLLPPPPEVKADPAPEPDPEPEPDQLPAKARPAKAKAPDRTATCEVCRRDFPCSPYGRLPKRCRRADCAPVDAAHAGPARD